MQLDNRRDNGIDQNPHIKYPADSLEKSYYCSFSAPAAPVEMLIEQKEMTAFSLCEYKVVDCWRMDS